MDVEGDVHYGELLGERCTDSGAGPVGPQGRSGWSVQLGRPVSGLELVYPGCGYCQGPTRGITLPVMVLRLPEYA